MQTRINKKKTINLISLGCSKNLVDSEVLMGQLEANHLDVRFETPITSCDAVVINTCGFINDAKQESIDTILEMIQAKQKGRVGEVYVMGCLSERYIKDLQHEIPEVEQYFGVNDIQRIVRDLGGEYKHELIGERKITTPRHYAYLKISEGCDRRCTFCAIPSIRGKYKSKPEAEILGEARRLAAKGVKEIMLIAQDLTYYGTDLFKKSTFPDLLNSIATINGLGWIRLHYTYPAGFPEEILTTIRDNPKICRYIDMPVQHINNHILSLMQRGHTRQGTYDLLRKIRDFIPDVAMRTTLIVGFPGETDQEFEELVQFVKDFKFDRLGVFMYSHEEGTTAYKLTDNVPEEIKRQRMEYLMDVQQEISLESNKLKIGKIFKTIIDRIEGNYYIGRTEFDSPEVDNEVLIEIPDSELQIGEFYPVEIYKADYFDLFGRVSHSKTTSGF